MDNQKNLLLLTVKLSIFIQIITGIIQINGLFFSLNEKDLILRDILWIETISQIIEFIFYIYIATYIVSIDLNSVTPKRYMDWVLSTPIMLISTIMYFDYTKKRKEDNVKKYRAIDFFNDNKNNIINIVIYNALMLLFGFLGETNILPKYIAIPTGFYFFIKSFYIIYEDYAYVKNTTPINKLLFNYMFFIWALYGVAALFPLLQKNISYNILDIFSKNFYGLFIFYKIYNLQN